MPSSLLIAVFGVLIASVLRGFTGFGFGLAAVPLLSLALPPAKVVPLVVVLQAMVGFLGLRGAWPLCDWRAVGGLSPGLVAGIPIGTTILTLFRPNTVRLAIGLAIAVSVVVLWRGIRLPPRPSVWVTGVVGLLSGVMSGLASVGGPPVVVYLLAQRRGAASVRATSIVYFLLAALIALVPLSLKRLIDREVLIWAGASIPVLIGGTRLGDWGFAHARPHHHKLTALVVLSILAALLIMRAAGLTD